MFVLSFVMYIYYCSFLVWGVYYIVDKMLVIIIRCMVVECG